jgi:uncharacterized membrane protein
MPDKRNEPAGTQKTAQRLSPARVGIRDISAALVEGLQQFTSAPGLSAAFAAIFVGIGLILFTVVEVASIAPISLSLAGGFMLVGPALLAGFFSISDRLRASEHPTAMDIWAGFRRMPRGGWALSFVCVLLFLIWITDAGILYGFMVGREPIGFLRLLHLEEIVMKYAFFSAIMGGLLAFILFAVSAFSIPLIYDRRAQLVSGVVASVRAVFACFPVMISWAALLAAVIIVSAMLLPLLLVSLPIMAYASRTFYLRVYPMEDKR